MATQDKNIVVYNSGELQKLGATDKLQIYSADFDQNVAVGGTLGVTGAATLSSTLGVSGITTLAALNASNTAITGTLSTTGAATLDSASITNNASVGGTLGVTGATTLSSTLSAGASTLDSATITNAATVGGTFGVTGATTLSSTLNAGASTLASASITGAATVGSTLGVTGAATLSSSLGVTGTSSFTGTMTAGDIDSSTLDASGNVTVGGTLGVTGATSLSSMAASGNATVGGTLGVTGASSLSTLSTSGAATLNSASITNAATVGGTLGVTGASTLSTLSTSGAATLNSASITNNASVGGTLGVTGATTLSSTLGVTGAATLSDNLAVAKDFSVATDKFTVAYATGNTAVAGTLGVTGAITGSSSLTAQAATLASAAIAGALSAGTSTLGNTTVGTLGASGAASLSSTLAVTGAATLSSTLGVTGATTLSDTLAVAGNFAVATNKFSVDAQNGNTVVAGTLGAGASTLSSASITNNATVGGTFGVTGASTLSSTLAVTGAATFSDNLSVAGDAVVNGDLTVKGSIVAVNQTDVVIKDAFLDLAFGNTGTSPNSGGFTISMNRASAFAVESVTDFAHSVGAGLPSFTVDGSTALVAGDVVAITGASDADNSGLFVVDGVAGSVVSIKKLPNANLPFAQTEFTNGTSQTASAYKVDLAVVAVADGVNFPQSSGTPWPKGTFITAYIPNATQALFAANGAYQSVGQVGLNEAYTVDNTITLTNNRDLVVNKPASGSAAIMMDANKASQLRVADAALTLGVWDSSLTTPQSSMSFNDSRSAGSYDFILTGEANASLTSVDMFLKAKTGGWQAKVVDGSEAAKATIDLTQSGAISLTAAGGNITVDAGNTNLLLVRSDTMFKASLSGTIAVASQGYTLAVAASTAAKKIVTASGAVAGLSAPNIMGVTLAAESAGMANLCTVHGSLVQVLPAAGASFSVGDVAYLAANGEISNVAPNTSGQYVMRVGYIVALPGGTEPIVQFAPQFIAKVL